MDWDFLVTSTERTADGLIPCAIRLKAPQSIDRISTHIILLLDVSESMSDDNKLENVKKCCELILEFLNENDRISLITFGNTATLHLNNVPVSELQKVSIKSSIKKLSVNGCTNLSAGLAHVQEVCSNESNLKTGLLVLTDGHANRGVHASNDLREIFTNLKNTFYNLSIHCVAYGNDHNAELLRSISEDCNGSYNIVNSIEDTAFAFGDTLGGLMSCAFQNVSIYAPIDSKVYGPHHTTLIDGKLKINLGDIYAGTKPLVLFDIPPAAVNDIELATIEGCKLPSLQKFKIIPILEHITERQMDIELTHLRYDCTAILQDIQKWRELTRSDRLKLPQRIDKFEMVILDPFFDGNPIAMLLRNEVSVLRDSYLEAKNGELSRSETLNISQHITSIGLGRGFSSPMNRIRHPPAWTPESDDGDPVESVFQNDVQTRMASVLRTASQNTD